MALKIGVYSISLNESQYAEKWAKSAVDADYLFVADTGSTDDTLSILKKNKVKTAKVSVKPWRFDDARNTALSLLPSDLDVVIALDMDEILVPGWRDKLETGWTTGCNRLRYSYVWSWFKPGVPDLIYFGDKIAGRHTHRWRHAVHEVLSPTVPEVICQINDRLIEHYPDSSKPRSQYLPLLELAVRENPDDDRNAHYLGREYFFQGRYHDAIKELDRHLSLPKALWKAERAASMRYMAKCYEALADPTEAYYWYVEATFEDPYSREAIIDAAKFALAQNSFYATLDYCDRAMNLPSEGGSYLNERYALAEGVYDLASVAHFHLGSRQRAIDLAEKALTFNPDDLRLAQNLETMKNGM